MIARRWHGMVPRELADRYEKYLAETGIKDYRGTEGCLHIQVLRRDADTVSHFDLTTVWESVEAIRRFAGDDIAIARYYPEDSDYLLELEPTVTHHDVVEFTDTRS